MHILIKKKITQNIKLNPCTLYLYKVKTNVDIYISTKFRNEYLVSNNEVTLLIISNLSEYSETSELSLEVYNLQNTKYHNFEIVQ